MTDNQAFYQDLGRRIKDARTRGHLTQEALATSVSLTRTTITNIEKGRQQLLVHTLVDIAEALNIAPELLLPEPQIPSIDKLLTVESPNAQEWIRRVVDIADRG
jgi:transcriptional regulator with XRE-family HTH domain